MISLNKTANSKTIIEEERMPEKKLSVKDSINIKFFQRVF
jgi:hypothetical protein